MSEHEPGSRKRAEASAVDAYEDVTYAERDAGEMKLDLYVPDGDGPTPLVVYLHGSAWVYETRKNAPDLRRYAAEWNCAFASVSYRLAEIPDDVELPDPIDPDNETPRGVFPDPIVDVKAAIRWLRSRADEYGFDEDAVAAWGSSAGGHLACLAGAVDDVDEIAGDVYPAEAVAKEVAPDRSGAVHSVVAWDPITDLLALPGGPGSFEALLLGGPLSEKRGAARRASPTTYVGSDRPPHLLMHGQQDRAVDVDQSRTLLDAFDEVDVPAVLYELHDLGHAWDADSERTAMANLDGEEHSVGRTAAAENALLEDEPPAGPEPIRRFLEQTLR